MTRRARLFVCEKTGQWAAAIRWQRPTTAVRLREFRNLTDAQAAWQDDPATALAVEVNQGNAERVVQRLLEASDSSVLPSLVPLLLPEVRSLGPLFWESGAPLVVTSPRRLHHLLRWLEHFVARQETPPLSVRDWVDERLPWGS